MAFTFAGNKFGIRNRSDDYQDNSTHIRVSTSCNITQTSNDTYNIGDYDDDDDEDEVDDDDDVWTKEQWLDYCRRVLYHVKETIITNENKGYKLENISYSDPECGILEVAFLNEEGRLNKVVITFDKLYDNK